MTNRIIDMFARARQCARACVRVSANTDLVRCRATSEGIVCIGQRALEMVQPVQRLRAQQQTLKVVWTCGVNKESKTYWFSLNIYTGSVYMLAEGDCEGEHAGTTSAILSPKTSMVCCGLCLFARDNAVIESENAPCCACRIAQHTDIHTQIGGVRCSVSHMNRCNRDIV